VFKVTPDVATLKADSAVSNCLVVFAVFVSAQQQLCACGWLGSRVVSVLDSGAEGPGFKSQ